MSNESFARHKHGHVGGIWTSATSHANLEISQSISQLEGGLTFTPLNSLALSCPCQGWGKATQHQRGHDRTCCWPPPPTGQAIGRQMHSLPHGHIQLGGGKGEWNDVGTPKGLHLLTHRGTAELFSGLVLKEHGLLVGRGPSLPTKRREKGDSVESKA